MQYVELNNGVIMPILGFGVYQIKDPIECARAVADALGTGYRLVDTAAVYHNESAVGRAIAASGIAREELFITSKLWVSDAGYQPTRAAFQRSLDALGLDYLDLYLVHKPYGDYYGSWRAMQEFAEAGLVRAIGVTSFEADRLVDLVDHTDIPPAVNQVETHPYFQRTADQQVMSGLGVVHQSWAPFAEGQRGLFTDPALTAIAQSHGRSVAQVVLRWLVQRGIVAIPKSVHRERIVENFDVFDFALTRADMEAIGTLNTTTPLADHRDPEFVHTCGTWPLNV